MAMQKKDLMRLIGFVIIVMLSLVACQDDTGTTNFIDNNSPVSPLGYDPDDLGACPSGCFDPTPDCQIKGTITGMGDWLYYLPGSNGYDDILVTTKYGGRWFCTESAAIVNNYHKAPE